MRLLLATLFVFGGILLVLVLLGEWMETINPLLLASVFAALFLLLCQTALILFNSGSEQPSSSVDYASQLQAWEELGLIIPTEYYATRAFEVAEVEDEGLHFFLELQDGVVLYLSGQYLYDISDAKEPTPHFPCTEFILKRHQDGWVAALLCRGQSLEYETREPAFWDTSYWADQLPDDGDIITDRTYDQLKNAS